MGPWDQLHLPEASVTKVLTFVSWSFTTPPEITNVSNLIFCQALWITSIMAFVIGPILWICAVTAVVSLYNVGPARKTLSTTFILVLVPILYPPMAICLSAMISVLLTALVILILYLGPIIFAAMGLVEVVRSTMSFRDRQKVLANEHPRDNNSRDITLLELVLAMLVAMISFFTTGLVVLTGTLLRAPFVFVSVYGSTASSTFTQMLHDCREEWSTNLFWCLCYFSTWILGAIAGIPILALVIILAIFLKVLAATLWPAYVACGWIRTLSATRQWTNNPEDPTAATRNTGSTASRQDHSDDMVSYGAIPMDDQHNDSASPLLQETIPSVNLGCLGTMREICRRTRVVCSDASMAAYQVIYLSDVISATATHHWSDPNGLDRIYQEFVQMVTGRRLWFSRQVTRKSCLPSPRIQRLLTRRTWHVDIEELFQRMGEGDNNDGVLLQAIWNGFWSQMKLTTNESIQRELLTVDYLMECPPPLLLGLSSVVMLKCCLRSQADKTLSKSEMLLSCQFLDDSKNYIRIGEDNRPKDSSFVDELWACLLQAKEGCAMYLSGDESLDQIALWSDEPSEHGLTPPLDPKEPLHMLMASLLTGGEAFDELPEVFQAFLVDAGCVNRNSEVDMDFALEQMETTLAGWDRADYPREGDMEFALEHMAATLAGLDQTDYAHVGERVETMLERKRGLRTMYNSITEAALLLAHQETFKDFLTEQVLDFVNE